MRAVYARRLLAGCGLAAAGLLAVGPTAAVAATTPYIQTVVPDTTAAPGSGGSTVEPVIFGAGVASHAVMTFDLSDVPAGVTATVADPQNFDCTTAATMITCTDYVPMDLTSGQWSGPSVAMLVTSAARLGATGTVHTTITADGDATFKTDSKVTVGEGVDLTAGPNQTFTPKPGGVFHPSVAVHNSGSTTAHGAAIWLESEYGLVTKRYSNCLYGNPGMTICTFDEDLAPGKTYGFSPTLDFQVSADTLAPSAMGVTLNWMTPQDWTDLKARFTRLGLPLPTTPGTDGQLTLTQVSSAAMSVNPPQTDTNPNDNYVAYDVNVTGSNPADLAALGATASGGAGATVHVNLGVKNNGPAMVRATRSGSPIVVPFITIPAGTTATAVPSVCAPATDENNADWANVGKPGAAKYLCLTYTTLMAGDTWSLPFTLHIDTVSNATGTVALYGQPQFGRGNWTGDTNTANDTATIAINPTGGGGGGGGGGLPVTGTKIGLIGTSGILVLVVGVVLRILARRRRIATASQD
jgi:hypothetical protein